MYDALQGREWRVGQVWQSRSRRRAAALRCITTYPPISEYLAIDVPA